VRGEKGVEVIDVFCAERIGVGVEEMDLLISREW
jgi:hypothetical protein